MISPIHVDIVIYKFYIDIKIFLLSSIPEDSIYKHCILYRKDIYNTIIKWIDNTEYKSIMKVTVTHK